MKEIFLYPITYPTEYNGIKCNVIINAGIQHIYIDKETNLIIKDEIKDKGKVTFSLVYEYSNEIPEDMNKLPNIIKVKNIIFCINLILDFNVYVNKILSCSNYNTIFHCEGFVCHLSKLRIVSNNDKCLSAFIS